MHAKLDDIQAFVAVAESGSFKRAAEQLNITQSALSRRLKKLEDALGARLLDRTTRRTSVSTVGAEFLPEAVRMVRDFERSLKDIQDLVLIRTGMVAVASNMTIADTLLPEIIQRYRTENPAVRIRVTESSSPAALSRVLRRESELAIAQFGEGHPDLEFEPLIEDPFVLICHPDHPLARHAEISWKDVVPHNFVKMRVESGTTGLLARSLGDRLDDLTSTIEVGHFNALLGIVGRNLGISAIPTLVNLKRPDLNLVTLRLKDPVVSRQIGLVTPKRRSLSPAAAAFRDICRDVLAEAAAPSAEPQ